MRGMASQVPVHELEIGPRTMPQALNVNHKTRKGILDSVLMGHTTNSLYLNIPLFSKKDSVGRDIFL